MEPYGVGIIGMGVGRRQAPGFISDPRISHVVLCDNDEERLQAAAEELGVTETTSDWRALVQREDLGLVSVASPDHLHAEMSVAALDTGKHVLCEKPMAMNLTEARAMIVAVDRSGCKLMVNNILRFFERFQYVKKLVDDGELGEIYAAEGDYIHNTLHLIRNGWRGPHRHSVMTGGGVHLIDLLRWIVGEIDEAFCYSTRGILSEAEAKSPDCMLAILRFRNGAVAKSMTNMAAQRPALHQFVLYGTKGVFINRKPDGVLYRGETSEPEPVTARYAPADTGQGQKAAAVAHLLDCIENDAEPLVNVVDGARSVAVCDAIYQSSLRGVPVQVEAV